MLVFLIMLVSVWTVMANAAPPQANFKWQPQNPRPGQSIGFEGPDSYSRYDIPIVEYWWDFDGDRQTDRKGKIAFWTFHYTDTFRVGLRVRDVYDNISDWRWKYVKVSYPTLQARFSLEKQGNKVEFDASPSKGRITRYEWGIDGKRWTSSRVTLWLQPGRYEVKLTVYDKFGRSDTTFRTVRVRPPRPRKKITYQETYRTQILVSLKDLSPGERMLVLGGVLLLAGVSLIVGTVGS